MRRTQGLLSVAGRAVGRVAGRAAGMLRRPTAMPPRAAPDVEYRPRKDGRPDPGEVVWAWVPYDENDGRGKDRPVLVIGRRGGSLLGLMLSSQDHDRDAADEARHGGRGAGPGSGDLDARGRPREVRVGRLA